jgi:glycosyltransferase involved in cell wall biosynthesis
MPNSPERDVRACKEARTLKQKGYVTVLLCWDRDARNSRLGNTGDYDETACLRFKTPSGITLLPFLPVWWSFVFVNLLMKKWDIVHALNFHSIVPSLLVSKLKRKSAIYEILDFYEWMLPRMVRTVYLWFDKLFIRLADAVIIADEAQIKIVGDIANRNTVVIYDSPPAAFREEDSGYPDSEASVNFTLFYAGALYRNRRLNLNKVVEAIKDIEGVKLIIAGYGDLVNETKEWSYRMPDKIEFIGKISYKEVIQRGLKADLFFILRDSTVPINRYTCGSNLFNAMICRKPILANQGSSTGTKTYEENCGLVVDANNIAEIREAVVKLRDDPELCRELGANARRAYEQKYSWEIMEKRLISLYRQLTPE